MRHSFLWLLGPLWCLGACTLLNAPDRERLGDGGTDGAVEGGPDAPDGGGDVLLDTRDAGPDAADAGPDAGDAGPDAGPREECGNDRDDDGNGLTDCEDFACAGDVSCCASGAVESIAFDLDSAVRWIRSGDMAPERRDEQVVFSAPDGPHFAAERACTPLAQGAAFTTFFQFVVGGAACDESTMPCEDFASVFLSSVTDRAESTRIFAELSVTVFGSGYVEFRRGRDVLVHSMSIVRSTEAFALDLRLSPVTSDAGETRLAVTGTIAGEAFDLGPQLFLDELVPCIEESGDGVGGLHWGLEGDGRGVAIPVDGAVAGSMTCTNPSVFRLDRNVLPLTASEHTEDLTSLALQTDWTEGGIRWPELYRRDDEWTVMVSASAEQPENEPLIPDFPWAISRSSSIDFRLWEAGDGSPYLPTPASEPSALYLDPSTVIAYVEDDAIRVRAAGAEAATWVSPSAECDRVHQPTLGFQDAPAGDARVVLFYLCEKDGGQSVRWQRRPPTLGAPITDEALFVPQTLFGAVGVRLVDLAVLIEATGPQWVRLWGLAESRTGERSLLLATGTYDASDSDFPLTAYPANPVGSAETLLVGEGATLEGIAVERISSHRLRFLLSRRLPLDGDRGRRWDLVALDQAWGLFE